MTSLNAEESKRLNWITQKLQALDTTQLVTISLSSEQVSNVGGRWEVRTVSWSRGFKFYSCDVDATVVSSAGVSVALVNATEALTGQTSGVPWVPYTDPADVPPPPPVPPPDLIQYGAVQVIDGRNWRIDTKPNGQTRKMEQTPFGWVLVQDWA